MLLFSLLLVIYSQRQASIQQDGGGMWNQLFATLLPAIRERKSFGRDTQRDRENESVYAFRDDQESLEKKRVDIRPPSVCQDSRGIRRIGRQETKEMRRSDSMMRHFQRATVAFHNDATERSSLFLLYPIRSYSTSRST